MALTDSLIYAIFLVITLLLCIVFISKCYYDFDVFLWYRGKERPPLHSSETLPLVIQEVDRRRNLEDTFSYIEDVLEVWLQVYESKGAASLEEKMKDYHLKPLVYSNIAATHVASFCETIRIQELTLPSLISIVLALEPYGSTKPVAKCIGDIICSTTGKECLQLRLGIDQMTSFHHLVFSTIYIEDIQNAILHHIIEQADTEMPVKPVQIVSDIDDTVYSVLFDKRFPPTTVYPGLHQFHQEFAAVSGIAKNKLVFITARPELFRRRTLKHLAGCGIENATLLMGTFRTLIGGKRMALQKLKNFQQYRRLFPEFRFIFIGDNGQADIDLGKLLLEHNEVSNVWIHDVIRKGEEIPYRSSECQDAGIQLFKCYAEAALLAVQQRILPPQALARVIEATTDDIKEIQFANQYQKNMFQSELGSVLNAIS